MNRRDFFRNMALSAGGVYVSTKTIFLPPEGGWVSGPFVESFLVDGRAVTVRSDRSFSIDLLIKKIHEATQKLGDQLEDDIYLRLYDGARWDDD